MVSCLNPNIQFNRQNLSLRELERASRGVLSPSRGSRYHHLEKRSALSPSLFLMSASPAGASSAFAGAPVLMTLDAVVRVNTRIHRH